MESHSERLVFAATQVAGSTRACAARGDAAMFDMLRAYYFQARAGELWRGFDERCRVQVKVGAGTVHCGQLGPPGAERFVSSATRSMLFSRRHGATSLSCRR